MISNESLTNTEKAFIHFFINNINECNEWRNLIIFQINQANVCRDVSPYYHIVRFEYDNTQIPLIDMSRTQFPTIQILHNDGTAPTVFTLLIRNGLVRMFEIYNADSSKINYTSMNDGSVHLGF